MRSTRRPLALGLLGAAVALSGTVIAASASTAATPSSRPAAAATASVFLIQGVDATTMTLSVDGKAVAPAAKSKAVVGPLGLAPGRHVVSATPDGGGDTVRAAISVSAGSSTDLVLHRQADATKPAIFTTYTNDLGQVTAGSGRLTVAHTAAVGPADIRVKGKVLFANVANGEQLTLTVPAGTYPVDIVPTAADGPVVFGPANVRVARASLTRVFAIGVAATNSMDAVVQVLPVATRGSGADPQRVEAGSGGQARFLIAAHEGGMAPGTVPGLFFLGGLLVLGVAAAVHDGRALGRPRPRLLHARGRP